MGKITSHLIRQKKAHLHWKIMRKTDRIALAAQVLCDNVVSISRDPQLTINSPFVRAFLKKLDLFYNLKNAAMILSFLTRSLKSIKNAAKTLITAQPEIKHSKNELDISEDKATPSAISVNCTFVNSFVQHEMVAINNSDRQSLEENDLFDVADSRTPDVGGTKINEKVLGSNQNEIGEEQNKMSKITSHLTHPMKAHSNWKHMRQSDRIALAVQVLCENILSISSDSKLTRHSPYVKAFIKKLDLCYNSRNACIISCFLKRNLQLIKNAATTLNTAQPENKCSKNELDICEDKATPSAISVNCPFVDGFVQHEIVDINNSNIQSLEEDDPFDVADNGTPDVGGTKINEKVLGSNQNEIGEDSGNINIAIPVSSTIQLESHQIENENNNSNKKDNPSELNANIQHEFNKMEIENEYRQHLNSVTVTLTQKTSSALKESVNDCRRNFKCGDNSGQFVTEDYTWKSMISDDEDETHPNIDTPSLFRWRHQARLERMEEAQREKEELEARKKDLAKKVEEVKQKLTQSSDAPRTVKEVKSALVNLEITDGDLKNQTKKLHEAKERLEAAVKADSPEVKQLQETFDELEREMEELKKVEEELKHKEKITPWNVDTISKPGFTKTVVKNPPPKKKENLTEEEKEQRMKKFIKENEKLLKQYGMLRKYDDSKRFLQEHSQLMCEDTANYLVIWCINLEMEEKHELMCHVAHQCICMQYILELSNQMDIDPRACVGSFFSKIQVADPEYKKAFEDELSAFKDRVTRRAKEKMDALLKEVEEEERQQRLGPGGLDPLEVLETLPPELRECFEKQDIPLLQATIAKMDEKDAIYHMKRAVDSGLWVPEKKQAEADANEASDQPPEET